MTGRPGFLEDADEVIAAEAGHFGKLGKADVLAQFVADIIDRPAKLSVGDVANGLRLGGPHELEGCRRAQCLRIKSLPIVEQDVAQLQQGVLQRD